MGRDCASERRFLPFYGNDMLIAIYFVYLLIIEKYLTMDAPLRILVVSRYHHGEPSPFIPDQVGQLERLGYQFEMFDICDNAAIHTEGIGLGGYYRAYKRLKKAIKAFRPDLIHAHYGIAGLLANLQRRVPVVTTYHGSDINNPKVLPLSRLSMFLSRHNIFVSRKTMLIACGNATRKDCSLIPCAVDTDLFFPMDKQEAAQKLGLNTNTKTVVFAGFFEVAVKNYPLAKTAVDLFNQSSDDADKADLIELRGYSRQECALLFNAVDCLLLTSKMEGSPQVIKEALACGCPIIATDVGDIKERTEGVPGCCICEATPESLAQALKETLSDTDISNRIKSEGPQRIAKDGLDALSISNKIAAIYESIGKEKHHH